MQSLSEYRTYFEALATSHEDIDSFYFGDASEIEHEPKSGTLKGKILWLDYHAPVRMQGQFIDNILGTKNAVMEIMGVPEDNKFDTRRAFYDECEQIAQEILARIEFDYQEGTQPYQPDFNSAQYGEAMEKQIGGTIFTGCRLEIGFLVPVKMNYEPSKWN